MATSSFFGYVEIDTKDKVDTFIHALEDSERKPERKIKLSHPASDADDRWIREHLSIEAK